MAQNRTFIGFEKEQNSEWIKNFTFIHATDPQFGLIAYRTNESDAYSHWEEELSLLHTAIDEWNHLKPSFIVITGDLVNAFPSISPELRRKQLDDLKHELSRIDTNIPFVLLSGNHDLGDIPTNESVKQYVDEFGDDYFSFWYNGVMFIVLNTQLYRNNTLVMDYYEQQDRWLDQQLSIAINENYKHIVVLQHIPWFFNNIDEEFNPIFTFPMEVRKRIVKRLYEANVRFIFAGHYHRNEYGVYGNLSMITSSAIGWQNDMGMVPNSKSGYRLVSVTNETIHHEYIEIGRSPSHANGLQMRTSFWIFIITSSLSLLVYLPNLLRFKI